MHRQCMIANQCVLALSGKNPSPHGTQVGYKAYEPQLRPYRAILSAGTAGEKPIKQRKSQRLERPRHVPETAG